MPFIERRRLLRTQSMEKQCQVYTPKQRLHIKHSYRSREYLSDEEAEDDVKSKY